MVSDEKGKVVSRAALTSIYKELPGQIGDANTSDGEVSFTPDERTYYRSEDADWEKGAKVPALLFANATTCTMRLGEVTLKMERRCACVLILISAALRTMLNK